MTSSIDSNVLVALWDEDDQNVEALVALDEAVSRGPVVICGAVYAELLAGYGRTKQGLDEFFAETGIDVDWMMDRAVWEIAGLAYRGYVQRRKAKQDGAARKMLPDFLIGAHAMRHGYSLLTQDKRLYKAAFPDLTIFTA